MEDIACTLASWEGDGSQRNEIIYAVKTTGFMIFSFENFRFTCPIQILRSSTHNNLNPLRPPNLMLFSIKKEDSSTQHKEHTQACKITKITKIKNHKITANTELITLQLFNFHHNFRKFQFFVPIIN